MVMILYTVSFGAGSKFGQTRRKATCAVNLRQMQMALSLYATEHNGAYPVQAGATSSEAPLSELVPRYTSDTSLFICPGSKHRSLPGAQPFADRHISYAYYMGLKQDADQATPLISDAQINSHAKHIGDPLFSHPDPRRVITTAAMAATSSLSTAMWRLATRPRPAICRSPQEPPC